jgi:hypothetical protein
MTRFFRVNRELELVDNCTNYLYGKVEFFKEHCRMLSTG